ncbi:hypothetical protein [Haloterrigena salinisoli]|uniref:hypothetical protein n=1 Tax=Haloterrigena salinisoli TaxID=3132747 RepID=UPI0030CD97F2
MIERDTVTELIAEARLRVDVPLERGGELAVAAQDVLESLAIVRYADVRELGAVDAGDDGLSVAIDCRLTLHVDDATAAAAATRRALRETDRVLGVDRFETVDGPYRIERW